MNREQKEVIIPRAYVPIGLIIEVFAAAEGHGIEMRASDGAYSLVLTEKSKDLVGFSRKVALSGALDGMSERMRSAFLADLSTLDCP